MYIIDINKCKPPKPVEARAVLPWTLEKFLHESSGGALHMSVDTLAGVVRDYVITSIRRRRAWSCMDVFPTCRGLLQGLFGRWSHCLLLTQL